MNRAEYLAQRKKLIDEASKAIDDGNIELSNEKQKDIKDLDAKFEAIAQAQANMAALKDSQPSEMVVTGNVEPINELIMDDPTASVKYRKAFMNFCKTGIIGKELQNADAYSTTTETAALIPTTILDETIKAMKTYGQVFSRVRKLSIPGGVNVPISTVKPTASWITEATPSSRQKLGVATSVSFSYYGLECKIATTLLAETVSLQSFEMLITDLMAEAFAKALDDAIVNGVGTTEPLGITADTRVAAGQKITVSAADFVTWSGWKKKVFAKIPLSYNNGVFLMAKGTFDGYIDGMVDANGQPIGRVTYGIDGVNSQRFGGKEVILVEDDIITAYDSADTADVVAVYVNLRDYAINSNMEIRAYRWLDQDKNQWVDKMIMIADGKLLDPNGVIIVKKGA